MRPTTLPAGHACTRKIRILNNTAQTMATTGSTYLQAFRPHQAPRLPARPLQSPIPWLLLQQPNPHARPQQALLPPDSDASINKSSTFLAATSTAFSIRFHSTHQLLYLGCNDSRRVLPTWPLQAPTPQLRPQEAPRPPDAAAPILNPLPRLQQGTASPDAATPRTEPPIFLGRDMQHVLPTPLLLQAKDPRPQPQQAPRPLDAAASRIVSASLFLGRCTAPSQRRC